MKKNVVSQPFVKATPITLAKCSDQSFTQKNVVFGSFGVFGHSWRKKHVFLIIFSNVYTDPKKYSMSIS